jgi:hypothetical protein
VLIRTFLVFGVNAKAKHSLIILMTGNFIYACLQLQNMAMPYGNAAKLISDYENF